MTIQRLSDVDFKATKTNKPLKICVVSFFGTARSGGVGTATSALIKHLAATGHKVTLLYTLIHNGKPLNVEEHGTGENSWPYWRKKLASEGVTLESIPHQGHHRDWAQKSWLVKEFLARHDYDVVYFDDWQGTGYYSLLAKRAGLAPFSNQLHCVITHATKQWVCDSNNEHLQEPPDIEVLGLERKSIEMADVVIGPSHYILREYQSFGWDLPERTFHQPLLLMDSTPEQAGAKTAPIDELVFFGRLESRKGLWLFCEALDRIAGELRGRTVTFLGPVTFAYGVSTATQVVERSARWPFQIRLVTELNTQEALAYLRAANRLAVIPSLADNSPCVIYECIEGAVPFVSTLGSGAEELIHEDDLRAVMVEPNVTALSEKLRDVLQNGATLARPSFDPEANRAAWSKWHDYIAANKAALIRQPGAPVEKVIGVDLPLFAFIDDGSCRLGLLVENLASHLKRLGNKANYLVLSSRRSPLKELLSQVFNDENGLSVRFFEPGEIAEARKLILSSQFTFFLDANVEVSTPFFVLTLDFLAQDPSSVVSCVGAVRSGKNGAITIDELPTGDIPGLAMFGRAVGGPVWAVSPAHQHERLSQLEFYDRQIDSYTSASALGEIFMHRCRLANVPIRLLPIVGAVIQQQDGEAPSAIKKEDFRAYCPALGITASLAGGGPAWFAISTFGPNPWEVLPDTDAELPTPPPLPALAGKNSRDPSLMAAAFGRPELALQMEASFGASPQRLQELSQVAIDANRQLTALDLADFLSKAQGMAGVAGAFQGVSGLGEKVSSLSATAVYADARLRIDGRRIRSSGSLRAGGPAKLIFADLPLSGQHSLNVSLLSRSFDPLFVRAVAIDQRSGQQIGEQSIRVTRGKPTDLSIYLYKLFGPTAVVVEFSGAEKMEVNIDTLVIK